MKNIFVTTTLRANLFFIGLIFIVVTLLQFEALLSATNRAIFLSRIHSVCDIKSADNQYEKIEASELEGVPSEYTKLVLGGISTENRRLRKECVLAKLSQSKAFPVKTDIGYQEVNPYPTIVGTLVVSLIVSLAMLIIKIFLIKTSQLSTGIFRLPILGVPGIFLAWFLSANSLRNLDAKLFEAITQTAITLLVMVCLYFVSNWVYRGFVKK